MFGNRLSKQNEMEWETKLCLITKNIETLDHSTPGPMNHVI